MSSNEMKYNLNPAQVITRGVPMNETVTNTQDNKISFDSKDYDFNPFFDEVKDLNPKIKSMVIKEDYEGCKVITLKTSNISVDERIELIDNSFIKLRDYGKKIGMGDWIDLCCVFVDVEG